MINGETGELQFEFQDCPAKFGSGLTQTEFRSSILGVDAKILVKNGAYSSFTVSNCQNGAHRFSLSLFFLNETLDSLQLVLTVPELENLWTTWSKEKELQLKNLHDKWLASMKLKPKYKFEWGAIESNFDPKSGFSSITIRYAWQGKLWIPE